VGIVLEEHLHHQIKLQALNEGKTLKDYLTDLIKKDLETKKEQTR
jgi:hypothetical protein